MFLKKKVQFQPTFDASFTDVATLSDKGLRTSKWLSLALHFVNISHP
jgi:hypothetical protein